MKIRGGILYKKDHKWSKHNKRIVVVTIILVVFSVITLMTNRSASPLETMLKDTVANIEYYVIKAPIQYVSSLFKEYTELKDVQEENAILKKGQAKLERESALNEVLTMEVAEMKELLDLNCIPTEYQVKNTIVIARDPERWNNEVTIDLGNMSGIKEGMAVVSAQGMIGTVTEVTEMSSTVTLLSSENNKSQLPIMILSGDKQYHGLLNRYDLNSKSYRITLLDDVEKIEKGAKVVTSGLGGKGKSPKGILVGIVDNYTVGDDATESICKVTPSVDFSSLNYVAVVQRVNDQ